MLEAEFLKTAILTLPWREKALLIYEYHEQQQSAHGIPLPAKIKNGWSIEDTSRALGLSKASVAYEIKLGKLQKREPDKLKQFDSKNKAINYVRDGDINEFYRVEFKYARSFLAGSLIQMFKVNGTDFYLVKLDKRIDSIYFEIENLAVPAYQCRLLRD